MIEVDENGVNKRLKLFLALLIIILASVDVITIYYSTIGMEIGAFSSEMGRWTAFSAFPILFGWFWCAPRGAQLANDYNRSSNWGFALGCLFNLVGVAFYWIYCWIFGTKQS